jgi:hypothetical protein
VVRKGEVRRSSNDVSGSREDEWGLISGVIIRFDRKGDWKGLAEYGRDRGEDFNDVNWALAINSLGRTRKEVRGGEQGRGAGDGAKGLTDEGRGEGSGYV